VRILLAPDKFKDALDASGVVAALAAGIRDTRPDAEIVICPLADGGEGTGGLLAEALGAAEHIDTVLDPLARPRAARWWTNRDRQTAIIEMAEASGLALLAAGERNALRTTSFGTGQLLKAAADTGCRKILLCVGGSATADGGAGCLQALGWEFADHAGASITQPLTGGLLAGIGDIRPPEQPCAPSIEILCDVDNPLLGPRGAAAVFGPQKGASSEGVNELERGLANWAEVLERCCHVDIRTLGGAGAAGGVPAGLVAALHARVQPGFDEVARHVGLRDKLAGCDLCFTGEGCIDDQTAGGKVVAGVARIAAQQGVPTLAFVGAVRLRAEQPVEELAQSVGVERIVIITPAGTRLAEALAHTAANLRRTAREALESRT
jgi:glycerate 2-kinase